MNQKRRGFGSKPRPSPLRNGSASQNNKVNNFTLNPQINKFFLTHPKITIPNINKSYNKNKSHTPH